LEELIQSHDLILADEKVIKLLSPILSLKVYKSAKKVLCTIKMAAEEVSRKSSAANGLIDAKAVKYQVKSISKSSPLALVPVSISSKWTRRYEK
jgi:hypothetical protein